jgi:thiamine-phosphate pyrophosphorylase
VKGYYFVTDSTLSRAGNVSDVRTAVACGVSTIQYRAKNVETREMIEEALALREICKDAVFLVNDRVDVALAVNADGVHLGQSDMPFSLARKILGKGKIIGVTVHDVDEALKAEARGADYLGVSPVFSTATKPDAGTPAGVALIREIRLRVSLPLVAIGGINLFNAAEVIRAGADSLCAISCVVASDDPAAQIRNIQELFGVLAKSAT